MFDEGPEAVVASVRSERARERKRHHIEHGEADYVEHLDGSITVTCPCGAILAVLTLMERLMVM
jgi:hypothetical protein